MYCSSPRAALVLVTLATLASSTPTRTSSNYSLVADYSGSTFFDGFTTFTGQDPTSGCVNYTNMRFAGEQGLLGYIRNETSNSSNAYIGVDYKTANPSARNSVRIMSTQTFEVGMVTAIDVLHAPVGFGLWPAIWLLANQPGVSWPNGGEQDIMEWVHDSAHNSMTLHTAPGCAVQNSSSAFQGRLSSTDCNANKGSDGCSIAASDTNDTQAGSIATAGPDFNAQGGGVYVHEWSTSGVTVWMFAHGHVPADLRAGNPKPSDWTQKPLAKFAGEGCNYSSALAAMQLIINIDFCGSWAGDPKVWESSGAANATKVATCDQYVRENAEAFKEAYFEIGSIKIFSSGAKPGRAQSTKREAHEPVDFKTIDPRERHAGSVNGSLSAEINGHRLGGQIEAQGSVGSESSTAEIQVGGRKGGHTIGAQLNITGLFSRLSGSMALGGILKREGGTLEKHRHNHAKSYGNRHLHRRDSARSASVVNDGNVIPTASLDPDLTSIGPTQGHLSPWTSGASSSEVMGWAIAAGTMIVLAAVM